MSKAMWFSIGGAVAALSVGWREWDYHQAHRYRPGPSGLIAVLGFAVVVIGVAVAYIAHELAERDR